MGWYIKLVAGWLIVMWLITEFLVRPQAAHPEVFADNPVATSTPIGQAAMVLMVVAVILWGAMMSRNAKFGRDVQRGMKGEDVDIDALKKENNSLWSLTKAIVIVGGAALVLGYLAIQAQIAAGG